MSEVSWHRQQQAQIAQCEHRDRVRYANGKWSNEEQQCLELCIIRDAVKYNEPGNGLLGWQQTQRTAQQRLTLRLDTDCKRRTNGNRR